MRIIRTFPRVIYNEFKPVISVNTHYRHSTVADWKTKLSFWNVPAWWQCVCGGGWAYSTVHISGNGSDLGGFLVSSSVHMFRRCCCCYDIVVTTAICNYFHLPVCSHYARQGTDWGVEVGDVRHQWLTYKHLVFHFNEPLCFINSNVVSGSSAALFRLPRYNLLIPKLCRCGCESGVN